MFKLASLIDVWWWFVRPCMGLVCFLCLVVSKLMIFFCLVDLWSFHGHCWLIITTINNFFACLVIGIVCALLKSTIARWLVLMEMQMSIKREKHILIMHFSRDYLVIGSRIHNLLCKLLNICIYSLNWLYVINITSYCRWMEGKERKNRYLVKWLLILWLLIS